MPKCKICNKDVKKSSDMIKVEDRKYVCSQECKDKFFIYGETKTPRQELLDYIGSIWDDVSFPVVATQIKQCQDNYGFKIEGMLLTLKYVVEVEEIGDEMKYGFKYVVERFYESAKDFYIDSQRRKKALESMEDDEVITCKGNDKDRKLAQFRANVKGIME